MGIGEAIAILSDQITYWEEYFIQRGRYPDDYSPELSEAMETVVEAVEKKSEMLTILPEKRKD